MRNYCKNSSPSMLPPHSMTSPPAVGHMKLQERQLQHYTPHRANSMQSPRMRRQRIRCSRHPLSNHRHRRPQLPTPADVATASTAPGSALQPTAHVPTAGLKAIGPAHLDAPPRPSSATLATKRDTLPSVAGPPRRVKSRIKTALSTTKELRHHPHPRSKADVDVWMMPRVIGPPSPSMFACPTATRPPAS